MVFVGALVIGVGCLLQGTALLRGGGTYWSDTQGRRRSNALAGAATLFVGVLALAGAYPMLGDVEPRLFFVAAAILGSLSSLWALVRANSVTAAPTLIAQIRTLLAQGHAPGELQIPGRSLIHDVIRARLAVVSPPPREPPGYRAAPTRSAADEGAVTARQLCRRGLVKAAVLGAPAATPLLAITFFAIDDAPLERLGWQVLAATTVTAFICAWLGWRLRRQVTEVRRALSTLLDPAH